MHIPEKRRVRRAFKKLVNPEVVESLLRDGAQSQPLRHGHIDFVLAFVRGESPAQVSERIARVASLVVAHGATVHNLVGALAIVAFGAHPSSTPESGSRSSLVQAMREQLAGDVKIVHGATDGYYGLFGSETWMSYSFFIPKFDTMLGTLSRLEFGQIEEFIK